MIAQIIAGMRKDMSDKELREWLNHKAEEAERRGNYGAADMYRIMALESVFQQRTERKGNNHAPQG